MSIPQLFTNPERTNSNYLPAVLKENKSGWIIEYYAEHPITHLLTRKQIRLKRLVTRYNSLKESRAHCLRMVQALNIKLMGGWNPFFTDEDARLYEKLSTVSELFLAEKKKELRNNSIRSYNSFINILIEWTNINSPGMFASMFNQLYAVRYMDYIYTSRNVGLTTYNNHVKMGRAFFNWMKEKCYTKQNPFDTIKVKPKHKKTRILIPPEIRQKIIKDLEVNNPQFLLMCNLVYNSLIRITEMQLLKVGDVKLNDGYIQVNDLVAKNHKTRFASLNAESIKRLTAMNLDQYPSNYYLFGSYLIPSAQRAGNGCYGEKWTQLRNRVKFPKEMQLYSLRDTGINEMLKSGIDDLSVMQHADHSSLEMTTLYGNHFDPNLIKLISEKAPKF